MPDPALGYPIGTPDGIPSSLSCTPHIPSLSLHGMLHAVAPPLAFLALVAACFVVARRFGRWARPVGRRHPGLAVAASCWSCPSAGFTWRLFVAVALGFAWIA